MADHGSRRRPVTRAGAPAPTGTPSSRATERLESRFAAELGLTRAAWDDALRRSDEQWRREDTAGLVESLEDQRRMLHLLEDRLCAVVSAAAVEREAERIVGSVSGATTAPVEVPAPPAEVSRSGIAAGGAAAEDATRAQRSRIHALAGAGAAVAVTMIAVALSVTLGLGTPPVPEVAAPDLEPTAGAEATPGGDFDHVVAIADHYAVSPVDLSAASTNWLQVLRALDLGTVETAPPAEDPETRHRVVTGLEPAVERPDKRERSAEAASGPDRADHEADEDATPERDEGPDDDRETDEADDDGLLDLDDLDDLDDLGQDEETSLPGIELQLP